jgi:hypothetical protein
VRHWLGQLLCLLVLKRLPEQLLLLGVVLLQEGGNLGADARRPNAFHRPHPPSQPLAQHLHALLCLRGHGREH